MQTLHRFRHSAGEYLLQGISPRRLALTLVVGFVVGCIPVVGLPTAICAVLALAFRLNQPAIQAANYLAMPFQVALFVPLLRLGGRLFPIAPLHGIDASLLIHSPARILAASPALAFKMAGMAGQALFAWLLLAIPVVVLLTPPLAALLRLIPAVAGRAGEHALPTVDQATRPTAADFSLPGAIPAESGD